MISYFQLAVHFLNRRSANRERLATVSERPALSILSKISVVDDDASVRAAIDNLLSSHGYMVDTFASAEAFLQSPQLEGSSCVIADVQMQGMSGLDLLRYMRSHGHNMPIILITAFPDESVRAQALQAGAICFLTKPFAVPDLIDCVKTALD